MTPVSKRPLYAALLLYFALTAALIARVPLALSPDEPAHWQYVEHIAQTGQLPVFRGAAPPAPGYEFHQPPLYYLLCAPGWKLLGASVQNYSCRVVSMLCGLATICIIWSAARLLFPSKARIATLAAGFAALFPLHQAVGAGSNNDSLAGLIAAALFYLMARMSQGPSRRDAWQFGLVAGLAILTKNTLLVLVFSGFIALIWSSKKPNSQIAMLPALGTALLIAGVVGGPWLARNQMLYGDPLALGAFSKAANAIGPGYTEFSALIGFFTYARAVGWITFLTMWGFFGGPNSAVKVTDPLALSRNPGPHVPDLWLAPLMLICLSAPILAAWGTWRRGVSRPSENPSATASGATAQTTESAIEGKGSEVSGVWWGWALGVVLVILAWAQFALSHFAGAQARYLHPVSLPFCIFMASGWARFPFSDLMFWKRAIEGKAPTFAYIALGASLLILTLLNVFAWKTLV